MKLNFIRNKYDIWSFSFTCFHECHEWKWGKCPHCISRNRCSDGLRPVYPSEEGIYYPVERIEISSKHIEDIGTYIHEFSEASIIQVMKRWKKDWNRAVKFEGYSGTYIAHFIVPFGANNGASLEPATKRNRPKW